MIKIDKIAIIGAGLMGHGIAVALSGTGAKITLYDSSPEMRNRAPKQIDAALATLLDAGVSSTNEVQAAAKHIAMSDDLADAVSGADLVIEAITENAQAKAALFETLAPMVEPSAILASNTSYLDIFPLLPEGLRTKSVIMHWYTPPYIIDLVDIVVGPDAPPMLLDELAAWLILHGKKPTKIKRFIPGYVANRIQMAIESEIFSLIDQGVATAEEIDNAIMHGLAARLALMGQFRKIDYTGLRNVRDSHRGGTYIPPTSPTVSKLLEARVEQGYEGVLSGKGFYDYSEPSSELFRKRDFALLKLKSILETLRWS